MGDTNPELPPTTGVPAVFSRSDRQWTLGALGINKGIAHLRTARLAGDEEAAEMIREALWRKLAEYIEGGCDGHDNPELAARMKEAHIRAADGELLGPLGLESENIILVQRKRRGDLPRGAATGESLRRQEAFSRGNCCEYCYKLAMQRLEEGRTQEAIDFASRAWDYGHQAFSEYPEDDGFRLNCMMAKYAFARSTDDETLLAEVNRELAELRPHLLDPSDPRNIGRTFALEDEFFRSTRSHLPEVERWIREAEA